MAVVQWKVQDGTELLEALDAGTLADLIPPRPGIYLWRRRLLAPSTCALSQVSCEAWLKKVSGQPTARLSRRALGTFVWMEGLQIGGGGISPIKEKTLHSACGSSQQRRLMISFVEALSAFSQPIYIGQTNNLAVRVKQHLDGGTGLAEHVSASLSLSWEDLQFHYVVLAASENLSVEGRALQEFLEMLAQSVLAPFATERPG